MINSIIATVLFVRDLDTCTAFYRDILKLPYQGSDADSSSFMVQERYLGLLSVAGAADLLGVEPHEIQFGEASRVVLAASVDDVDAAYEELRAQGVTFVRPPTDQRWGMRTAHFVDPEGNLWEINQSIESQATDA